MKGSFYSSIENEKHIATLIAASLRGNLTAEQQRELDEWLQQDPKNRAHFERAHHAEGLQQKLKTYYAANKASVWQQTKAKIHAAASHPHADKELLIKDQSKRFFSSGWWAAAVLLLCLSIGAFFYLQRQNTNQQPTEQVSTHPSDLAPGDNRATLTLADGRTLVLEETHKGTIAAENGIQIRKTEDGQLVYELGKASGTSEDPSSHIFNTITTPQGGQYQVVLPDGTHVWLNATSSLRYPIRFTGEKRLVELQGEGYFEVAPNQEQPFIVRSKGQEVQVLGTHFNISAYADEPTIKTTLVEGSVQVVSTLHPDQLHLLKPGQQATLTGEGRIAVQAVDTEPIIAWHMGYFMFRDMTLDELIRQLARWYGFEYTGNPVFDHGRYTLYMSRRSPLSKIMRMLEAAGGVTFEIDEKNRRVISKPVIIDKR